VSAAGGCLCGAVRYRVSGALRPVVACHCKQCRRTSGHHVAATAAPRQEVEITGAVRWYCSSTKARRGFCPVCGSNLFWDEVGSEMLSIWAGTLDDPTGLTLVRHIFVASKGDYYVLADGVAQHQDAGAGPVA
jgi:hypothetical protein